ncbi:hypothetical protein HPP92_009428 [Vanilla planifolia]|uniref:Pentatricopeptide repeat-containing protein n=1 Tax=Vanilla planifolia TaxID=51239 RepID=A0A835RBI1_VANPL|nr:hypothetical protein HPP92_009428 [Vanilla planifolia]
MAAELSPPAGSWAHSPVYESLLCAGTRIRPLTQVHARIVVSGLHRSRSLLTKLLTLAVSSGHPLYAQTLLPFVPDPDPFLFSSLIRASSRSPFPLHSLRFYRLMLSASIPPSNSSLTSVLKACADLSAAHLGRILHSHVVSTGFNLDRYVQTALLVFYAKHGDLVIARKLFDRMPERTVVAWNAMISGYEQNGHADAAIEHFHLMREQGIHPDSATLAIVLSACAQGGALHLGQSIHDHRG